MTRNEMIDEAVRAIGDKPFSPTEGAWNYQYVLDQTESCGPHALAETDECVKAIRAEFSRIAAASAPKDPLVEHIECLTGGPPCTVCRVMAEYRKFAPADD